LASFGNVWDEVEAHFVPCSNTHKILHLKNLVNMKQVSFILLTMGFLPYVKPISAQFLGRPSNNVVGNADNTIDMYRTPRVGIGFTTNTAFNTALGTANRARLAVRDGIIAHHVSDTIGNFAGKWLGLGIGNPGGPAGSPKPYGLAIADTGSVAFFNVLRENFNGVIRKNTVAGFGAEYINANRFIITGVLIVVMGVLLVLGML